MRRMIRSIIALGALAMSACVYPTSTTTQGGFSSALSFSDLPPNATVLVDGAEVGRASDYSGGKVLAVSPGTHKVTARVSGSTIVDREYYVGRDSTVKVQAQ
jgi:hypothetical protein